MRGFAAPLLLAAVDRAEAHHVGVYVITAGHADPLDGVLIAGRYSLVEYNCPAKAVDVARQITPGFSAPTIQQTSDPAWLAVKVLVEKSDLQAVIDRLEEIGCVAILETEVRHARL